MPVTNAITDVAARTITLISEFDAPPARVWKLMDLVEDLSQTIRRGEALLAG